MPEHILSITQFGKIAENIPVDSSFTDVFYDFDGYPYAVHTVYSDNIQQEIIDLDYEMIMSGNCDWSENEL